jgi:hypothetical protein
MKPSETENGHGKDAHQRDKAEWDDSGNLSETVLVLDQEIRREAKDSRHVQRQWDEEKEKVAVISAANTIVDPRTVMIKRLEQVPFISVCCKKRSEKYSILYLDTLIANGAMWAPRRSVELASDAPLHPHCHSVNIHIFIQRSAEVVIFVLVRRR